MQIQFLVADVARKFCDIVANEDTTFFTFLVELLVARRNYCGSVVFSKIFCYNEIGGAETKK